MELKTSVTLTCESTKALDKVAEQIIAFAGPLKVWTFEGEMGAGKTTLIQAICKSLGVQDHVSSPTYSIVNEYHYNQSKIFHFDFYRIKSEEEAWDIGYEDYVDSGQLCLVEWPSKIAALLPESLVAINIEVLDSNTRKIFVTK